MTAADPALLQRAEELGIEIRYRDVHGQVHDADPAALAVIVELLDDDARSGAGSDGVPGIMPPVVVVPRAGSSSAQSTHGIEIEIDLQGGGVIDVELVLDDGTVVPVEIGEHLTVPSELPYGCHTLHVDTAAGRASCTVVRAPDSTLAGSTAAWLGGSGLFVPTYALWDHDHPLPSFGLLGRLARSIGELGTDLVTTLPLYATFLDEPFDPSPYAPASRLHWNEVFLDDAVFSGPPAPPQGRYLDWRTLAARRREQLLRAAAELDDGTRAALDRFVTERPDVDEFARFLVQRGTRTEVGTDPSIDSGLAADNGTAHRSHVLAQYLANRELAGLARGEGAGLAIDLPIGCHVDGFERWAHPELFAADVTIGAPPDHFFTEGQNWGLPPQLPSAGRRSGHRLWRELLTRAGEHAALLRVDHVMAVHRLWWVPDGFGADQGVYVRYPREELLAVIAATAASIGTTVVGEDLGTVPGEVEEALRHWDMLGMYEEQFHTDVAPPIPARTVSGIRTHDMAPFAAFVTEQGAGLDGYRRRLSEQLGHTVGDSFDDILDAVIERLARSNSAMVTIDLDDLVGEVEPHNVPGRVQDTTWRRRSDRALSDLLADPDIRRRLTLLDDRPARA